MESGLRKSAVYRYTRFAFLKTLTVATGKAKTPRNGSFRVPRGFNPDSFWDLLRGRYEKPESEVLRTDFKPDDLIIEIGSNVGYIARQACAKLKPNGKLICVEANPETLPYLEVNLAEKRDSHEIHIVAAAIGAPTVEGERRHFHQRNNLGSSLGEVTVAQGEEHRIDVEVRSLSSLVDTFDPEASGYSLICDAEGAEILIITKDADALSRCRQIAIELHHPALTGSNVTPVDMIRMLEEMGFVHGRAIEDTHYFYRP